MHCISKETLNKKFLGNVYFTQTVYQIKIYERIFHFGAVKIKYQNLMRAHDKINVNDQPLQQGSRTCAHRAASGRLRKVIRPAASLQIAGTL